MRVLAYLAMATFFSISALVSARKPWFGFIYHVPGGDKIAHVLGAGGLAFFMLLGFSSLNASGRPRAAIGSLTAAALLVTVDEVLQLAIPARAFEWSDLGCSLIGVLVFGFIAIGVQWLGRRRRG